MFRDTQFFIIAILFQRVFDKLAPTENYVSPLWPKKIVPTRPATFLGTILKARLTRKLIYI